MMKTYYLFFIELIYCGVKENPCKRRLNTLSTPINRSPTHNDVATQLAIDPGLMPEILTTLLNDAKEHCFQFDLNEFFGSAHIVSGTHFVKGFQIQQCFYGPNGFNHLFTGTTVVFIAQSDSPSYDPQRFMLKGQRWLAGIKAKIPVGSVYCSTIHTKNDAYDAYDAYEWLIHYELLTYLRTLDSVESMLERLDQDMPTIFCIDTHMDNHFDPFLQGSINEGLVVDYTLKIPSLLAIAMQSDCGYQLTDYYHSIKELFTSIYTTNPDQLLITLSPIDNYTVTPTISIVPDTLIGFWSVRGISLTPGQKRSFANELWHWEPLSQYLKKHGVTEVKANRYCTELDGETVALAIRGFNNAGEAIVHFEINHFATVYRKEFETEWLIPFNNAMPSPIQIINNYILDHLEIDKNLTGETPDKFKYFLDPP